MPDGRIGHVELAVGDASWMMSDEHPEIGVEAPAPGRGAAVTLHLTVEDCDEAAARVAATGVEIVRGPEDSPPAGRVAVFVDPFGHRWFLNGPLQRAQCRGGSANQPGAAARKASAVSAPDALGDDGEQRDAGHPRQVLEVAPLGQAGLGRPGPDDQPGRLEAARPQRADGELGVVERAEPGGRHDDHLDVAPVARESGREVEQRAALGVEPDQQPAGALDDHDLVRRRVGRRSAYDATVGIATPWPPGGGVGGERLVEHGPLLDVDAGRARATSRASESAVGRAGLHRLHHDDRRRG